MPSVWGAFLRREWKDVSGGGNTVANTSFQSRVITQNEALPSRQNLEAYI